MEIFVRAVEVIVNPILKIAIVTATILFTYGVFEFIRGASNPESLKKGQQHMLWGLIGLTIMVSVFAIVRILANSLGADTPRILPGL